MCDKKRYELIAKLEQAVDDVTLYHVASTKNPENFAFNFAMDSLVRRLGRLKAYEERQQSDK